MKNWIYILLSLTVLSASSCFTEEEPIQPLEPRSGVVTTEWATHGQVYYSLKDQHVIKGNGIYEWDLAFSCAPDDYTILLNTAKGMGCYNTSSKNFAEAYLEEDYPWEFEKSNGQEDHSAIGAWGDFEFVNPQSFQDVYILNMGIDPSGRRKDMLKFRVNGYSNGFYSVRVGDLKGTYHKDYLVAKNDSFNHVYLSFGENRVQHLEPPKNEWDLLFTPYVVPIGKSDPRAPFFHSLNKSYELVDGVLLNPYNREIRFDSNLVLDETTFFDIESESFTDSTDLIGQWWYKYNDETNTFETTSKTGFIIRDEDKNFYALKFTEYSKSSYTGCTTRFIFKNL